MFIVHVTVTEVCCSFEVLRRLLTEEFSLLGLEGPYVILPYLDVFLTFMMLEVSVCFEISLLGPLLVLLKLCKDVST